MVLWPLSYGFSIKYIYSFIYSLPSVLWCCWLGGRKGIRPVESQWWGAGIVICLEQDAELHTTQLMPLPLTVSCFSKIQIVLPFRYWLTWVVPAKGPLNGCVCVWGQVQVVLWLFLSHGFSIKYIHLFIHANCLCSEAASKATPACATPSQPIQHWQQLQCDTSGGAAQAVPQVAATATDSCRRATGTTASRSARQPRLHGDVSRPQTSAAWVVLSSRVFCCCC